MTIYKKTFFTQRTTIIVIVIIVTTTSFIMWINAKDVVIQRKSHRTVAVIGFTPIGMYLMLWKDVC